MTSVQMGLPTIGLRAKYSVKEIQNCTLQLLARALNSGRCMAFIGSGLSCGYGYPSWTKLTLKAVEETKKQCKKLEDQQPETWRVLTEFMTEANSNQVSTGLRGSEITWSDRLLLVLNMCEEALTRQNGILSLSSVLANEIGGLPKKKKNSNNDR